MGLLWISVADKPGGDKGGESVASEEKLWVIKLRYSCHLCCLKLVNFVLNSSSVSVCIKSGAWDVNLHLFNCSFNPRLQR